MPMIPREGFFDVDGLKLHYLDWGTRGNPAVLLLHGLAVHARSWDHTALALRDGLHLVALDQRGHGDSDHPPPESYRTAVYAADILTVADALGWDRFSIVGQSMGGHNAMFFAAEHPDRMVRLVISDSEPAKRLELIAYMREAEHPPEYDSLEEFIAEAKQRNPQPTDELHRHRAEHAVRRLPNGRLTVKYDFQAPKRWQPLDLWPRLGDIRCPTLLLRGGESPVLRPEVAERMVREIPDCHMAVIPGAGHSLGIDNPAAYEAAIREFLTAPVGAPTSRG
jgi:pimeloyl-ACP methyl ester carboxylesterase